MATQRDWNVDEPVRKLEKLSLAGNRPSPREELEGALGTDQTESEIEQALSSRGPLPEQLLTSRVGPVVFVSVWCCVLIFLFAVATRTCPRSY